MPLDKAYAGAMEQIWRDFPEDPEVNVLFAESLMNLQPWDLWTGAGVPKGRALEIVSLLDRTLAKFPQHPGANHLFIHAIEASPWPELGLPAAERLAKLVPGSGHLVHMPSHIYIRTGRYADAVNANQKAIAADEAYFAVAPKPDFYALYFVHNIHFLAYAAMMEGRYQTAMDAARKIETQIPQQFLEEYVTIADGFMTTALHVMLRFGKWDDILAESEPPEWRWLSRAERHFARSVAYSALGDLKNARAEIEQMDAVASKFTDDWKMGNNTAAEVIAIARHVAEGELAFRSGETKKAFESLADAAKLEETLRYDEPPGWMQPARHAWGALLLADEQFAAAEDVYRDDLKLHPKNAWSLLGLQQALEKQGKDVAAKDIADEVKAAWANADIVPIASCFCHPDARNAQRTKE
jgi:tetratricopeptide (TPR) repeat protein